jgi:hydroxymethylpyrimidine/phosphomethylpyrimidine kinase
MSVSFLQQHNEVRPRSVLSIAGSDSGGGAGIQADLKTFAAHGLHGLSAIAALTAQNTCEVRAVHTPEPAFLRAQLEVLFADFRIVAVKIGMLANAAIIDTVGDVLELHRDVLVVLDPVMIASSGAALLEAEAVDALRRRLLPRADVLTPNLPEAETLLGTRIADRAAMPAAAAALLALGSRSVLLKGGHLAADALLDLYCDAEGQHGFVHPRLALDGHGTGCTLSSAIAAQLALGKSRVDACSSACDYVHGALKQGYRPGRGSVAVLDHFWRDVTRAH